MRGFVYTQYRDDGAVLYVGCTKRFDERQRAHVAGSVWGPLIDKVDCFMVEPETMLDAEREHIQQLRPIFNKVHNPRYVVKPIPRPEYRCPTGWLFDVAAWDDPFGTEIFKMPKKEQE